MRMRLGMAGPYDEGTYEWVPVRRPGTAWLTRLVAAMPTSVLMVGAPHGAAWAAVTNRSALSA